MYPRLRFQKSVSQGKTTRDFPTPRLNGAPFVSASETEGQAPLALGVKTSCLAVWCACSSLQGSHAPSAEVKLYLLSYHRLSALFVGSDIPYFQWYIVHLCVFGVYECGRVCGGQRATLGAGPGLPPCLRRGLWLSTVHTVLAGL